MAGNLSKDEDESTTPPCDMTALRFCRELFFKDLELASSKQTRRPGCR